MADSLIAQPAEEEKEKPQSPPKDVWDILNIQCRILGALVTPLVIFLVGYMLDSNLKRRELSEAKVRLYSELMSRREEAESALRKDMFNSILQSFLKPKKESYETRVLYLELLTYNFHEDLNLRPLFLNLSKEIRNSRLGNDEKKEYSTRLEKAAKEIVYKQLSALDIRGNRFDWGVVIDNKELEKPRDVLMDTLCVNGVERTFKISLGRIDTSKKEVYARLEIVNLPEKKDTTVNIDYFRVGYFDFPTINNTRLTHDQRCAVALNDFSLGENSTKVNLSVVCFPGSYASLKEKSYYEDIVSKLTPLDTTQRVSFSKGYRIERQPAISRKTK